MLRPRQKHQTTSCGSFVLTPNRLKSTHRPMPPIAMMRQPLLCPSERQSRSATHPPQAMPIAIAIVTTNAACLLCDEGRFISFLK